MVSVLVLETVFSSGSALAAPAPWKQAETATRGNLAAMLERVQREAAPPQYRTSRSADELFTVLKKTGRFVQLGLTDAEGKILVEAVYRKLNLPLVKAAQTPALEVQPQTAVLPFNSNYRVGQEFENLSAVLLRWPFDYPDQRDEWGEMINAMAIANVTARVWVDSNTGKLQATRYLRANGYPTSHIQWVIENTDSIWIRDYGPQYLYDRASDGWGVADFHYYTGRPADDDTPIFIAESAGVPRVDRQDQDVVFTEGGNINVDGLGFVTYSTRTYTKNPGVPRAIIDERITSALQATRKLVVQDPSLDSTGHVDMFLKILNTNTVFVAEYDPGEVDYQVLEDAAAGFRTALNGAGQPWTVIRLPQPDVYYTFFILPVVRTYTNSLIVNNVVIVPVYGIDSDETALALYAANFPGKTIYPVNAERIIESGGSWHCVTMEFPNPQNPD